jgi:TPR repeat protein
MIKSCIFTGILAVLLWCPGGFAATDFDSVQADYEAGNLTEAFEGYMQLAEEGNAVSQYNLGAMYLTGEGTEKDLVEAWAWTRLSADRVTHDNADYVQSYLTIEARMTPEQKAAAMERYQHLLSLIPEN